MRPSPEPDPFQGKNGMEMSVQAAGIKGLCVIQARAERPPSGQVSFKLDSSLGFCKEESDP